MEKHEKVIAVDFDGTLCENAYPDIGPPRRGVISRLKSEIRRGAKVILWTCRRDELLWDAEEWCCEQGITFDAVNKNLPELIEAFGGDTRKIAATEYWDDKAVAFPPEDDIRKRRAWGSWQRGFWMRHRLNRIFAWVFVIPLGLLRTPRPAGEGWMSGPDDVPYPYPTCPRCGEPLYKAKFCVFCGQRIKREWR